MYGLKTTTSKVGDVCGPKEQEKQPNSKLPCHQYFS